MLAPIGLAPWWPPHPSPIAPQPQTTLTLSTFNLININYDNLWLHTLNVVEGLMWIGKNSLNNFICHLSWLRKLSPIHTHPLISICEFLKTYELLFFELESLIKCWMWMGKNSLNNFMCHLSWFKKLSPTHTHPLKTICEFLTPYQLLFFELESLIKCWMWLA